MSANPAERNVHEQIAAFGADLLSKLDGTVNPHQRATAEVMLALHRSLASAGTVLEPEKPVEEENPAYIQAKEALTEKGFVFVTVRNHSLSSWVRAHPGEFGYILPGGVAGIVSHAREVGVRLADIPLQRFTLPGDGRGPAETDEDVKKKLLPTFGRQKRELEVYEAKLKQSSADPQTQDPRLAGIKVTMGGDPATLVKIRFELREKYGVDIFHGHFARTEFETQATPDPKEEKERRTATIGIWGNEYEKEGVIRVFDTSKTAGHQNVKVIPVVELPPKLLKVA